MVSHGAYIQDGFSNDELLNIGTRKVTHDLNMSASDINNAISFEASKIAQTQHDGLSEQFLKDVGERRASAIAMPDSRTTPVAGTPDKSLIETAMDNLGQILGIRTR